MDFLKLLTTAVDDPAKQADPQVLSTILSTTRQTAAQQGASPEVAPSLLSTVGSYVRSALRDRRREQGPEEAESLVNRYSGLQPDEQAVESLFPGQERARVERSLSQETGLQPNAVAAMLPVLVPLVLKFLQGGNPTQGTGQGNNSLLSSFMDADRDGDVDIGDALSMVGRFIR